MMLKAPVVEFRLVLKKYAYFWVFFDEKTNYCLDFNEIFEMVVIIEIKNRH